MNNILFDTLSSIASGGGGRYVGVFVCYLDDSYSDASGVVTLAGYFAKLDAWKSFEEKSEKLCRDAGVKVIHAHEFRRGSGDFKGWSRDRKCAFVDSVFSAAAESDAMGISVSVKRSVWKEFKHIDGRNSGSSPLGMAFGMALMEVCEAPRGNPFSEARDCAFVVEQGNKNNAGIAQIFNRHKKQDTLSRVKSLTFVSKDDSRAIQLADFWAYYSRRMALKVVADGPISSKEDMASYIEPELISAVSKLFHTVNIVNGPVRRTGPSIVEIGNPISFHLGPIVR